MSGIAIPLTRKLKILAQGFVDNEGYLVVTSGCLATSFWHKCLYIHERVYGVGPPGGMLHSSGPPVSAPNCRAPQKAGTWSKVDWC